MMSSNGSVSIVFLFACLFVIIHAADIYNVDPTKSGGRRFDGIGGLSGGGATSKLLVNYPEEQRDQILDYLFKPGFGASLHILKVEIGGDAQSTDGTEASHMHYSWDENYQRGYEWWLMKEAKMRNPDIRLYCLPWAFPAWVGAGSRNPYHKPELTATYVIKYILGAQKYHNLTMNYVGIWNERPYDTKYIKILRQMLDSSGLKDVQIVAADGTWEPISLALIVDKELSAAVDIIGVHYPGTTSSEAAIDTGKALWSSEDYSTFNDNVGAGCWARILNQNYVNGNMTSTISWNLIASYYENLPYGRDGLMTADRPWSGFYRVDATIWMTAHTTQFVYPGWNYLAHDSGVSHLKYGGSMVSLASFDGTQLTIVIETMSHNHSLCIRPFLPDYTVKPQNITIQLKGLFAQIVTEMNVRYSKLGFDGQDSVLFKDMGSIQVKNATLQLSLGVDEIITLTTLQTGQKGNYDNVPVDKPFPLPYMDNFESYEIYKEPFNFSPQVGSFEVLPSNDTFHSSIMRQTVIENPLYWCLFIDLVFPMGLLGDYSWSDIYVEADAKIGTVNATNGAFIGARLNKGGCNSFETEGIFFFIFPNKGLEVTGDLARTKQLYAKNVPVSTNKWYTLGLLVKDGFITGSINKEQVFNITLSDKVPQNGFVGLGTASYGLADFDNLKITSSEDGFKQMKGDNPANLGNTDNKKKNSLTQLTREKNENVNNKGDSKYKVESHIAIETDTYVVDVNALYFESFKKKNSNKP